METTAKSSKIGSFWAGVGTIAKKSLRCVLLLTDTRLCQSFVKIRSEVSTDSVLKKARFAKQMPSPCGCTAAQCDFH